jgi:cation transport ATPase
MPYLLIFSGAAAYIGFKWFQIHQAKKTPKEKKATLKIRSNTPSSQQLVIQKTEQQPTIQKNINHNLTTLSLSLASATAANLFYPPLFIPSIFVIFYTTIPIWKNSYQSFIKEHQLTVATPDSILLSGHYFVAALLNWFYYFNQKHIFKIKSCDPTRTYLTNEALAEFPTNVWLIEENIELEVPVDALKAGDLIIVKAGERIPVDGMITEGIAFIDLQTLTGKPYVRKRSIGDAVLAFTRVLSRQIYVQVQQIGSETVMAKLTQILAHQTDLKNSSDENLTEEIVLPTLTISALALPLFGISNALAIPYHSKAPDIRIIRLISTLNMTSASSPIAHQQTPKALPNLSGFTSDFLKIAEPKNILIKDGWDLERLNPVEAVVFEKNSILTQEKPIIVKIHTFNCIHPNQLLYYAAIAYSKQTHPIAKLIVREARRRGLTLPIIPDSQYDIIGHGIKVIFSRHCIRVGPSRFIKQQGIVMPEVIKNLVEQSRKPGYFILLVTIDHQICGIIELNSLMK